MGGANDLLERNPHNHLMLSLTPPSKLFGQRHEAELCLKPQKQNFIIGKG